MRDYQLPERMPDEDNGAWLKRAAASIPAESLLRLFVKDLVRRKGDKAWLVVAEITAHGSGVSSAIVERWDAAQTKE